MGAWFFAPTTKESKKHDLQFVAVNDLGDAETNAHLLKYDTAHGRFRRAWKSKATAIVVNGDRIQVVAERDPAKLPWRSLGVDVVLECTGLFTSKAKAGAHLQAGARKVIISAPGEKDVDRTVVFGVNHETLKDVRHGDLERLVHHQLPRAARQGDRRPHRRGPRA